MYTLSIKYSSKSHAIPNSLSNNTSYNISSDIPNLNILPYSHIISWKSLKLSNYKSNHQGLNKDYLNNHNLSSQIYKITKPHNLLSESLSIPMVKLLSSWNPMSKIPNRNNKSHTLIFSSISINNKNKSILYDANYSTKLGISKIKLDTYHMSSNIFIYHKKNGLPNHRKKSTYNQC